MNDLLSLAERCEKAMGPDRELDGAIHFAVVLCEPCPENVTHLVECTEMFEDEANAVARYTASLDAAMQLVPEGWTYHAQQGPSGQPHSWQLLTIGEHDTRFREQRGKASTPALALCAASLRARDEA
jgi:hypothetical protein